MAWTVALHDEFDSEFDALPGAVRKELIAKADRRFDNHLAALAARKE